MLGITARRIERVFNQELEFHGLHAQCYDLGWQMRREGNLSVVTLPTGMEVAIRRNGSDVACFEQCLIQRQYEHAVQALKESDFGKNDCIVDAGANVGYATIFLSQKFPGIRILAIEPDRNNFEMLLNNIERNKLHNVYPINGALWESNCRLKLDCSYRDGREWSRQVAIADHSHSGSVEAVTMEELLEKYKIECINLLKIDIEGSEYEIFRKKEECKKWLAKVKNIAMELHYSPDRYCEVLDVIHEAGFITEKHGEVIIGKRN
jgi:FkbM family methyltransferase